MDKPKKIDIPKNVSAFEFFKLKFDIPDTDIEIENISFKSMEQIYNMMREFAEIKCEEQRQLCFNQMKHQKFGFYKAKKEDTLNCESPVL